MRQMFGFQQAFHISLRLDVAAWAERPCQCRRRYGLDAIASGCNRTPHRMIFSVNEVPRITIV